MFCLPPISYLSNHSNKTVWELAFVIFNLGWVISLSLISPYSKQSHTHNFYACHSHLILISILNAFCFSQVFFSIFKFGHESFSIFKFLYHSCRFFFFFLNFCIFQIFIFNIFNIRLNYYLITNLICQVVCLFIIG